MEKTSSNTPAEKRRITTWLAIGFLAIGPISPSLSLADTIIFDDAAQNGWTYTGAITNVAHSGDVSAFLEYKDWYGQLRINEGEMPIISNSYLQAYVNFLTNAVYTNHSIGRVDMGIDGTVHEYAPNHDDDVILVDGVRDTSGHINFDMDTNTWQLLSVHIGSPTNVLITSTSLMHGIDFKTSPELAVRLLIDDVVYVPHKYGTVINCR